VNDFDIFCISESRLRSHHNLLNIDGYQIKRADATENTNERGIAILHKNSFKCSVIEIPPEVGRSPNIEMLCIKIQYRCFKSFIVACIYRHPNYLKETLESDNEAFDQLFSYLSEYHLNTYIIGDFNLRDSSLAPLTMISEQHNFTQLIDQPTRNGNLLDLLFINNKNSINSHKVSHPAISDHALIECKLNFVKPVFPKKSFVWRNMRNVSSESFVPLLESTFPDTTLLTPDEGFSSLVQQAIMTLDTLAPQMVVSKPTYSRKTFITSATKSLIIERDAVHRELQKKPEDVNLKIRLSNLKKICKLNIKRDTKSEMDRKIHADRKNANLWKTMKNLLKTTDASTALNMLPDEINEYFASVSRKSSLHPTHIPEEIPADRASTLFVFTKLQPDNLLSAWKLMKKKDNSTMDPVGMSNLMLNYCLKSQLFLNALCCVFNTCIDLKYFPNFLKVAKIVPIPKIVNPKTPSELRPISIQPVLAKLFEKCLFFQFSRFLEQNNIICPSQYGFRSRHSTFHALANISDFINNSLDKNEICILVTLDIRKAFDRVDRDIICKKLLSYNIDPSFFKSYLNNRYHFVSLIHEGILISSDKAETELGVVQGSCLSNLLFLLVMNDLHQCLKFSSNVLFVDDVTLMISGSLDNFHNTKCNLQTDLVSVHAWTMSNILELNDDKSTVMFIARPQMLLCLSDFNVCFNGRAMNRVHVTKILGVLIDDHLSWLPQANKAMHKCRGLLWSLYPLKSSLNFDSKKIIVDCLINSVLFYCCIVWLNSSNFKIIERVFRQASRFVCNISHFESVSLLISDKLSWLFPKYRLDYELFKLSFLSYHSTVPVYFNNYIVPTTDSLITRNRSYPDEPFLTLSSFGKLTIKYQATKLWNNFMLNNPIDNFNVNISFLRFKSLIHEYLIQLQKSFFAPSTEHVNCDFSCIDYVVENNTYL
jgi:hypothetical protein